MRLLRRSARYRAAGGGGGGGGANDSHTYWRIYVTAFNHSTTTYVGELQFAATADGPSQTTGGTVLGALWSTPEGAFAGDAGASYASVGSGSIPLGLGYQFASAVTVSRVRISSSDIRPERQLKSFDIQYSDDGVTWTTALTVTDQTNWVLGETRFWDIPVA